MKAIMPAGWLMLAGALSLIEVAAAQPTNSGCSLENSTDAAQTFRCQGGVTIIARTALDICCWTGMAMAAWIWPS